MSAYRICQTIFAESSERCRRGESDAFELRVHLRSGRILEGSAHKPNTYFLKMEVQIGSNSTELTYIPWDAIDQVTPIWF